MRCSPREISPNAGEIPTFPQLRRAAEKWKTKRRFPTFPPTVRVVQPEQGPAPRRRSGYALPPHGEQKEIKTLRQEGRIIVVDREK